MLKILQKMLKHFILVRKKGKTHTFRITISIFAFLEYTIKR